MAKIIAQTAPIAKAKQLIISSNMKHIIPLEKILLDTLMPRCMCQRQL